MGQLYLVFFTRQVIPLFNLVEASGRMCEGLRMAYLNWQDQGFSSVSVEFPKTVEFPKLSADAQSNLVASSIPTTKGRAQMGLRLGDLELRELVRQFEQLIMSPIESATELRLVLPSTWTLFCKLREGGSRILLAHPTESEWVGTVALESDDWKKLLLSLKKLQAGESLRIGELFTLGQVSNLDISIGVVDNSLG